MNLERSSIGIRKISQCWNFRRDVILDEKDKTNVVPLSDNYVTCSRAVGKTAARS